MELKKLDIQDTDAIKKLIVDIFSREPWNDIWEDAQLQLYVLEIIGNKNSLSFGLYEDGVLIGMALGRIRHWCRGTEYWIDEFGILPEKQSKGAGSEFLRMTEDYLSRQGIGGIVLLTERTAYAYEFYKRNGFHELEDQAFLVKRIS